MKNENINSKKNGKIILLILGAVLGVVLLIVGSIADIAPSSEKEGEEYTAEISMNADEYARQTEERISQICSGVRGVSGVKVVVTLSGGYNAVYAQNSQSSSSGYRNEFVLTGNGSSEKPLLIGYSVPQISGIGIVCVGGGNSEIRQEIISLVGAAFNVSANKIYVTEAQN